MDCSFKIFIKITFILAITHVNCNQSPVLSGLTIQIRNFEIFKQICLYYY